MRSARLQIRVYSVFRLCLNSNIFSWYFAVELADQTYGTNNPGPESVRGPDIHRGAGALDERLQRAGIEHDQPNVAHARSHARVVRQVRGRPAAGDGCGPPHRTGESGRKTSDAPL